MMPIRVRISQHSSLVLTPRAAQERGRGPEEGASPEQSGRHQDRAAARGSSGLWGWLDFSCFSPLGIRQLLSVSQRLRLLFSE